MITGYELESRLRRAGKSERRGVPGARARRTRCSSATSTWASTLKGLDRVVLDLAEPWQVVAHARKALAPGGIFLAYLPGINQTAELRAVREHSGFAMAETFEILRRSWHIEGRSVRPDHRMVAHTGFITSARLLAN